MINKIIEISKEAGEIAKEGFGKNFDVEFKLNESDLVTKYDKKSEKAIVDFVKKEFPKHAILAEEGGNYTEDAEYTWVIDPIDGTTNFAHGLPVFSISIGVQKNGETIAGVVYDVTRDVIYSAELGSGAFANSKRITVSSSEDLSRSVLVTGFPYNIAENPNRAVEMFIAMLKKARAVRRLGSAAIDFCYVASGIFEGFWEVHLNPWDICAGKLMVEEAGGKVTDLKGEPIDIFSKQILATNGIVADKMMEILNNA